MEKNDSTEDGLAATQKNVESAAGKVAHRTKWHKEKKTIMSTPENVRLREEAAARCTAKIKRMILRKQARKARADLVKCSMKPGKKKTKRNPLTELYVKGHFTEDRGEWQKELQSSAKRCILTEQKRKKNRKAELNTSEKRGNQQFIEEGRNAEITVDLVWQARAKLSEGKVNGPEDVIVSEMIKKLPMEKIYIIARCFQERFVDQMESPSLWKAVKLVFLKKPDAAPTKGIKSYRAIALTSVMSKWFASCILLRLERENGPGKLRSVHIGEV